MPKTIITKEICKKAKNGLIKLKSHGTAANKLKAIIAAYSHVEESIRDIWCRYYLNYRWAIKLEREGYKSLINQAKHQDGIKLKKLHKETIKKWLEKDPNISIIDVKERIEDQFDLKDTLKNLPAVYKNH